MIEKVCTAVAVTRPGRGQCPAAVAVAALLLACLAIPFGNISLPEAPAFLPGFGALTLIGHLLTAAILLRQAAATHDRATAGLGAAYLFSAVMLVAYLLAFPGALTTEPLIGHPGSALWLWSFWHAGFALLVVRYALFPKLSLAPVRPGLRLCLTVATALACIALATCASAVLPTVLVNDDFTRFNILGFGPAIVALNTIALMLVMARLRNRHVLALWLAVAMQAAALESILTLWGGERFTLGWYLARALSVGSGLVVLLAILAQLLKMFDRLSAANRRLETLARTDPLTQLANRRAFDAALATEWRRAARTQTPLALLAIDVDKFKTFNDRYGHPAGDGSLRHVAQAIATAPARAGDLAARIGGEEFAVLLPGCTAAAGAKVAAQIHHAIAAIGLSHIDNLQGRVTVSVGVAARTPSAATRNDLSASADRALYTAKETGRNQTCLADPAESLTPARQSDTAPAAPTPSREALALSPR